MIPHPDEITEPEICIAQIPEILNERFRDPVIARRQQLIGGQTSEAESPKRRNEIRGHAVVTQLLEIVEGKILVSRISKTPDELAGHSMVPKTDEPMRVADAIAGGTERLHVVEVGTVHAHDDELVDRRTLVALRT
jgi:hypothetical protein